MQIKKINQNNLQPFDQHYLNMETIFINSKNSKTSQHRFKLNLPDKRNLKDQKKHGFS